MDNKIKPEMTELELINLRLKSILSMVLPVGLVCALLGIFFREVLALFLVGNIFFGAAVFMAVLQLILWNRLNNTNKVQ
jgi:uncharacterized membrane protein